MGMRTGHPRQTSLPGFSDHIHSTKKYQQAPHARRVTPSDVRRASWRVCRNGGTSPSRRRDGLRVRRRASCLTVVSLTPLSDNCQPGRSLRGQGRTRPAFAPSSESYRRSSPVRRAPCIGIGIGIGFGFGFGFGFEGTASASTRCSDAFTDVAIGLGVTHTYRPHTAEEDMVHT
jgi:hypothetical protein